MAGLCADSSEPLAVVVPISMTVSTAAKLDQIARNHGETIQWLIERVLLGEIADNAKYLSRRHKSINRVSRIVAGQLQEIKTGR